MKGERKNRFKRKRRRQREVFDLEGKVAAAGGEGCFGLEVASSDDDDDQRTGNGESRRSTDIRSITRRSRQFQALGSSRHNGSQSQGASASTAGSIRNPYSMRRARRSGQSTITARTVTGARSDVSLPRAAVHIVCALGENLARETCVASLNAGSPVSLQVTKQANGQTYAQTLAYLEILNPNEVLLNEGRQNSQLAAKVLQLFGGSQVVDGTHGTIMGVHASGRANADQSGECKTCTVVKFISRSCFDQTRGAELLRRVARDDTYDASLVDDYIVLSSAHAVLHYTQQCLGATISRNCLELNLNSGGSHRMAIDRSTLLQLELLANAKTGKTRSSLMATIDNTKTTVGSRLLRTNLMAPPCRADTINARLDLVDTLLSDEDLFYTVLEHLESLPDVDKMLANVAIVPQARNRKAADIGDKPAVLSVRVASKGISALVCIKTTLTVIPGFASALSEHLGNDDISATEDPFRPNIDDSSLLVGLGNGPSSPTGTQRQRLMNGIINAMRNPGLAEVLEAVSDIFTESTSFSRSPNAMRHQECFALKSEDNGMMDVLRKAFLANVDDIYKKADEYAETYKIHVNVKYATSRGYYLSIPGEIASTLPQIFIQPAKSGNNINCTTEEVNSLNTRAQDNVNDLLLMTNERIKEVLDFVRSKYDALASLSDAVALLDLCHSFADNVTLSKLPWCRPVITDGPDGLGESNSNTIAIREGRYGIDVADSWQSSDGPGVFVPNDTYATEQKSFTLLTGANGSGKSTYLKQIGIIVVLAHCGSYIPAEQASIPIRTRLSARIGTADDQESNISSFMLEMKETAFICSNASTKSLILLDELGRATSNEDGIAIAWSVSEYLLSKHAMTFFVTHYPQLCRLSSIYPASQNQHLEANISGGDSGEIQYTHKVTPGPCSVAADYGVHMSLSCGWPIDVSETARAIDSDIRGQLPDSGVCDPPTTIPDADTQSLLSLVGKILRLVGAETSISLLRSKLTDLRESSNTPLQTRIEELLEDSELPSNIVGAPEITSERPSDDMVRLPGTARNEGIAIETDPSPSTMRRGQDRDDDGLDSESLDGDNSSSDAPSSNSSGAGSSLPSIDSAARNNVTYRQHPDGRAMS